MIASASKSGRFRMDWLLLFLAAFTLRLGAGLVTGRLALDYGLSVNSSYAARTPVNQWNECDNVLRRIDKNPPDDDAAYIFSVGSFKKWGASVEANDFCDIADGAVFCRRRR